MEEHLFAQNQGVVSPPGLTLVPPGTAQNPPSHMGFASPPASSAPGGTVTGIPLAQQITSISTRLKLAEERYANLSKRNQLAENSVLEFEREVKAELRVLSKQLSDLRRKITEINNKLDAMNGELGVVVRKHEFAILERYIDLWQPMQFVSRDEAARMIAQAHSATNKTDSKQQ